MYQARPEVRRDKVGGVDGAGDGVEHGSFDLEVEEVDGWAASDDAVIVFWVCFCCFDAHPPTEGAADEV